MKRYAIILIFLLICLKVNSGKVSIKKVENVICVDIVKPSPDSKNGKLDIDYDEIYESIKLWEGLHKNNNLYVCYGHSIIEDSDRLITNCDSLLKADLQLNVSFFGNYKDSLLRGMLAYNCGSTKVMNWFKNDTLISESDYLSICNTNGKKNNALLQRRIKEYKIYKNGTEK